jgi:cyanophycinase-like exopeptidase
MAQTNGRDGNEQKEVSMPGIFVLCGGHRRDFRESESLDRYVLTLLGDRQRLIVYVPTAGGDRQEGTRFAQYYRSLGATQVVTAPVYTRDDAASAQTAALLRAAGMIYIGGGDPKRLLSVWQDSTALAALRDAAAQGTLILGNSAGAMAMGRFIAWRSNPGDMALAGFDILPQVVALPHFDAEQRLLALIRLAVAWPGTVSAGIPEAGGLIIWPSGQVRNVGPASAYVAHLPAGEQGAATPHLSAHQLRLMILAPDEAGMFPPLACPPDLGEQ